MNLCSIECHHNLNSIGFLFAYRYTHISSNKLKILISISGEKALVEYLEEEIVNETNSLKGGKTLPTTFNGFQVKYNGADVELIKKDGSET